MSLLCQTYTLGFPQHPPLRRHSAVRKCSDVWGGTQLTRSPFDYSFSSDRYPNDVHHYLFSATNGRVFYAFEMPEWRDSYDGVDGPSPSTRKWKCIDSPPGRPRAT